MKENKMTYYFKRFISVKVKVWHPFAAIVLLGSILTACVDSIDNPVVSEQVVTTGDDASDKTPFKETLTTVNKKGKTARRVALRYYNDMPHVAYIAVTDFQAMLVPNKSIRVNRTAASQYTLVTSKGETATVNTADEKMTFDDYMSFVSLENYYSEGFLDADDEISYVREMPGKYVPAAASITFDLKKYGIDLRGDGQTVYVPLTTLADIFSDTSGDYVMFNGEKIILTDFDTKPFVIDATFVQKPFEKDERPADLAAYSYGELCFVIDHFYGRPGRNAIDKTIEEKGMDQALSDEIRQLLKSTKMDEYIFGMACLGVMLDDGGHTNISPISNSAIFGGDDKDKLMGKIVKFITAFENDHPIEAMKVITSIQQESGRDMAVKEREKLLNSDTYAKIGNTVYCIFDDFGPINRNAWTAFYKGTGPMPKYTPQFKGDICGIVEALDVAAADPEVKNFVLDLTCNNGGDSRVLVTITNLLAGKNSMTFDNILTKQRVVQDILVDGNFDRVFDDKDNAPRYPQLNIAILTSHYAFSCGNLLPSLMKDYGYLIIGEKSGGGSCSIQQMCTAEGFCYILSSARARLVNKAGENIDNGIEPQIALEVKQKVGMDDDGDEVSYPDFSAFYDASVGDQIVNWYAKK
jgi:hypothetical protein